MAQKQKIKKNKNRVAQKKWSRQLSVKAEVKLWGGGFVKEVHFKLGVKERKL